jgi:hypothetical protein
MERATDRPVVNDLTISLTDNLAVADAWTGEGDLDLLEADGEELHALAPIRIESAFRYSLAYSVTDLGILKTPSILTIGGTHLP